MFGASYACLNLISFPYIYILIDLTNRTINNDLWWNQFVIYGISFLFFNSKKAAGFAFIPKIIQAIGLIHYFTRINNDAKGFNHTKASHTVKKNRHIWECSDALVSVTQVWRRTGAIGKKTAQSGLQSSEILDL